MSIIPSSPDAWFDPFDDTPPVTLTRTLEGDYEVTVLPGADPRDLARVLTQIPEDAAYSETIGDLVVIMIFRMVSNALVPALLSTPSTTASATAPADPLLDPGPLGTTAPTHLGRPPLPDPTTDELADAATHELSDLIPAGPLTREPATTALFSHLAALRLALGDTPLGTYDHQVLTWLARTDDSTTLTIASLFRRARHPQPA